MSGSAPGTARTEPSSPSSPTNARPSSGAGRDLLAGRQQGGGDGEIETRPDLAQARRGEVDRHAAHGPRQLGGEERGPDAVAGLAAGGVGQAHDGEAGQALGHVDLDPDGSPLDTEEGGGLGGCEHGGRSSHTGIVSGRHLPSRRATTSATAAGPGCAGPGSGAWGHLSGGV